jgi:hypothetical protein
MKFLEAQAAAIDMVKDGEALAYGTGYNREMGRYIDIETDQGWSNFWMEFEDVEFSDVDGGDLWL